MIEYIKFYDHTKSIDGSVTQDQALELDVHIGEFCPELIKEDDKSITVSLLRWETNKDISHEFVYVILKNNIIERYKLERAE